MKPAGTYNAKSDLKTKTLKLLHTLSYKKKKKTTIRVQLVPIKTLQSLHAKFRVINENLKTNLDWTIISRD